MDVKWSSIAQEEEAGDRLVLPPTSRIDLDDKGRFLERKYWMDEETGQIKMSERYAIKTRTTQRVPKTAKARMARWVKFGEVAGQPMGVTESGITTKKTEPTELQWLGVEQRKKRKKPVRPPPPQVSLEEELAEEERKQAESAKSQSRRTFQARKEVAEELKFELKISNLPPKWGESKKEEREGGRRWQNDEARDSIRALVDAVYHNHLGQRPPHRYRIKVWVDRRHGVHAAVEFDREDFRDRAIEILDGHTYGHRSLSVVKSTPRPRRDY